MTSGHGIAAADGTDNGGSSGADSASTSSATDGSPSGAEPTGDADTGPGSADEDADDAATTSVDADDDADDGADHDEERGADTEAPDGAATDVDSDVDAGVDAEHTDPTTVGPTTSPPPPPALDSAPQTDGTEPATTPDSPPIESAESPAPAFERSAALPEPEDAAIASSFAITPLSAPAQPTTAFPTDTGNPVLDFLHTLATAVNNALPAYPQIEGASPTQVAAAVVVAVKQLLDATLVNGAPTPLSIPMYVLFVAAYQRFEQVATNRLPALSVVTTSELIPGTVTGKIIGIDPDGDPLVYSLADSGEDGVAIVLPDGSFTYTATKLDLIRYGGDAKFFVNIDDSLGSLEHPIAPQGHVATVEVTVQIEGIWTGNTDPVVLPSTGLPDAAGIVKGQVLATDLDDDPLSFSVTGYEGAASVSRPNGAIVQIDTEGNWVYIPSLTGGTLGVIADSFTVYVSDGRGGTTSTVVGILTKELDIDYAYTAGDGTAVGGLSIPPGDIGLLTYSLGSAPGSGSVTVNEDGTFGYLGTEPATFTIVGTNAYGDSLTVAEITVTPVPPNNDPTVDLVGVGIGDSAGIVRGKVDASDQDGDTLYFSVVGYDGPQSAVLSNGALLQVDQQGNWTYIPPLRGGVLGVVADGFTVYVSDGRGGTASTPVGVLTKELDIDYTTTVAVGAVTGALVLPADGVGLLTYSLGVAPSSGTVTVTPQGAYSYIGTDAAEFTIVGTNTYGDSITVAEISVTPAQPNSAPQLVTTGLKTTPLAGKTDIWTGVTVKDVDGDSVTWSYAVSNGTVTFSLPVDVTDPISGDRTSSRTVTYKSNGGSDSIIGLRNGPADTIYITVTDPEGASLTFTLSYPQ